ncbi:hypothetical protein [Acetobacter oeni]|uniref:Uncharacterized protein n=1 Tax=Acetobacter oeni TaxID=304077 RepID=A0A511XJQ4_9PROT|nr:hypothetical protein [Acetobacter oeni]MBB3883390.1 hypothetical protein [Acetobacter oeni]NHO19369.1 hypothetical protein [Acetobacter oeni]GBR03931.1 hypothetical protein AA21952_1229 [Acetobacter oeni LMG 21952]GEN63172.1 hypothetical protein AOE01nite_13960 [Acetobacter oeni]
MEVQNPKDTDADGSREEDRLPVLARQMLTFAQAWAVMHPAADAETRRLLVAMIEVEIMAHTM